MPFIIHFSPVAPNTYPMQGWTIAIQPGIAGMAPITGDLKQLPPVGRLVYRAPEGETIIARAELQRAKLSILTVSGATCRVRNAATNAVVVSIPATYANGRISAPLTLDQGIYDVEFEIVLEDGNIIAMARPIRLLVGPI